MTEGSRPDHGLAMDLPAPPDDETPDELAEAEPSLFDELGQLFDDGRTYAEAEIAYQRARLSYGAGRAPGIAILFAAAVVLVLYALIALVVGLLMALAPLLTIWGAMAVVAGSLLVLAVLAYLAAMRKVRRTQAVLSGDVEPEA